MYLYQRDNNRVHNASLYRVTEAGHVPVKNKSTFLKSLPFILLLIIVWLAIDSSAQNVGIGESSPANKLSIKGSSSIGSSYSTTAAPSNGLIIQGNTGIGTASPQRQLHLNGSSTFNYLHITNSSTGTSTLDGLDIGVVSGEGRLMLRENADLAFYTNSLERMTILNTGMTKLSAKNNLTTSITDMLSFSREADPGTPAAGMGVGLSFNIEDTGGLEEQASIDVSLGDASDGTEESVISFNTKVNGSMSTIMKLEKGMLRIGDALDPLDLPTSGVGIEMFYTSDFSINKSYIISMDRGAGSSKPLIIQGSYVSCESNLGLGSESFGGSSASRVFAITNGTAPISSVTNSVLLFSQDVSSSAELRVRDEAGNVTTLSPHNFSLIPEGSSEELAWSYYSEKDGMAINVDMLKLARILEELTGEKLVHIKKLRNKESSLYLPTDD